MTERYWEDIGYHCVVDELASHWMSVKVYKAVVTTDVGSGVKRVEYEKKNAMHGMDVVERTEDAQVYLSGVVKWDGCSNLQFDEQENAMLHFCGKQDATNIGVLLGRIYDLAAELIPAWSE